MPLFSSRASCVLLSAFVLLFAPALRAVTVHGTVTDSLGAPIPNATVALVQNGKVVISVNTHADGTFQLSNAAAGQFYVLAGGKSFRELTTGGFYGGELTPSSKTSSSSPSGFASRSSSPRPDCRSRRRR